MRSRRPLKHRQRDLNALRVLVALSLCWSVSCETGGISDEPTEPSIIGPDGSRIGGNTTPEPPPEESTLAGDLAQRGGEDEQEGAREIVETAGGMETSAGSTSLGGEAGAEAELEVMTTPPPQGVPQFRFPINDVDVELIDPLLILGVDHDPSSENRVLCEDAQGRSFPFCYDQHQGTDYMLLGGFDTMDMGSAGVVSAARGEVIEIQDGHYDRCHANLQSYDVECDGYPMRSNLITLLHEGGWRSSYYHLKSGSITVSVGDEVICGQAMALIGSSGYSSAPHLHFEIEDASGQIWDPYQGPSSQPFSLWTQEGRPFPSLRCASESP